MKFDPKTLEELVQKLGESLPPQIRGLQQDIVCDKLGVTQTRTQLVAYTPSPAPSPGTTSRLGAFPPYLGPPILP